MISRIFLDLVFNIGLTRVCRYVKEFDCNLTREIVELIDREADLLNRGRDPKSMEGGARIQLLNSVDP